MVKMEIPVRQRLLLFLLYAVLSVSNALVYPLVGSSASHSDSASSKAGSSQKTVHVRSYTRKDGTVVQGYDRSAPGTKAHTSAATTHVPSSSASIAAPAVRDSPGRIKRSAAAKDEFERETGYQHGRPGYVVDHVVPLACGGADAPNNMQWQTAAEAKTKDQTERIGCK
jgi:hypothetical protein